MYLRESQKDALNLEQKTRADSIEAQILKKLPNTDVDRFIPTFSLNSYITGMTISF